MQNKPIVFRIYFILSCVAALAASALRTLAVFRDLDYATGYYADKLYIGIADKLAAGAVILAISFLLTAKRSENLILDLESPLNYVFSGVLGCVLLIFAAFSFGGSFSTDEKITKYLLLAVALTAVLASLYFLWSAIFTKQRSARRADFGLTMVIFLSVYSAYLYFNQAMPINSPAKILSEMAFLFSALFFLYETRISIAREKWRAYAAFGFSALILTAYSSLPALLIYIIKGRIISDSIQESALCFVIFLFIFARLTLTSYAAEDKESRVVLFIKEAASERELALIKTEEAPVSDTEEEEAENREYYELNFEASDESDTTEDKGESI